MATIEQDLGVDAEVKQSEGRQLRRCLWKSLDENHFLR